MNHNGFKFLLFITFRYCYLSLETKFASRITNVRQQVFHILPFAMIDQAHCLLFNLGTVPVG